MAVKTFIVMKDETMTIVESLTQILIAYSRHLSSSSFICLLHIKARDTL